MTKRSTAKARTPRVLLPFPDHTAPARLYIVRHHDATGAESVIDTPYRDRALAESQRRMMQRAADLAGATVTYRIIAPIAAGGR